MLQGQEVVTQLLLFEDWLIILMKLVLGQLHSLHLKEKQQQLKHLKMISHLHHKKK